MGKYFNGDNTVKITLTTKMPTEVIFEVFLKAFLCVCVCVCLKSPTSHEYFKRRKGR
jgi:hypothetical protein